MKTINKYFSLPSIQDKVKMYRRKIKNKVCFKIIFSHSLHTTHKCITVVFTYLY